MQPFAVVDTNFIYAVIDTDDQNHRKASAYYRAMRQVSVFPSSALAELAYFMHRIGGNYMVAQTLSTVRQGSLALVNLEDQDYDRTAEILRKYHDTRIDFVDASIMALAERMKITRILTFDHRDFRIFKPSHIEGFVLLP